MDILSTFFIVKYIILYPLSLLEILKIDGIQIDVMIMIMRHELLICKYI